MNTRSGNRTRANTKRGSTERARRPLPFWVFIICFGAVSRLAMLYAEEPPRVSSILASFVQDDEPRIEGPERVRADAVEAHGVLVRGSAEPARIWTASERVYAVDRAAGPDQHQPRRPRPITRARTSPYTTNGQR